LRWYLTKKIKNIRNLSENDVSNSLLQYLIVNCISEIDKYSYHFLIDELVWHLDAATPPLYLALVKDEEQTDFQFSSSELESVFLKVNSEALYAGWVDAKAIVSQFSERKGMHFLHS
jgi:hypothetical protein